MKKIELPKELIISDALRKMLEESDSSVAKKLLEVKDVSQCSQWINYLDIAKDDSSQISYLDEKRYLANYNRKEEQYPKVGDTIIVEDGRAYYSSDYSFTTHYGKEVVITKILDNLKTYFKSDTYYDTILRGSAIDGSFEDYGFRPKDFSWQGSKLWDKNIRYMGRCGKVVQKLLGPQDGKELAKFCEMFQATHPDFRFQIDFDTEFVKGEDIRTWYNVDKYESESGELGSSCMRYDKCYKWLEIYSKNDKLIQMFIVKDKASNKLLSRCLIWNNEYYDRIYSTSSIITTKVMKYLESLGIKDIYDKNENVTYDIEFGSGHFSYFPYCDSFRYLSSNKISNSSSLNYDVCMDDADGGNDDNDDEDTVWCEISHEDISRDSAYYVDEVSGYVHESYVKYSEHYDRHILEDDCVHSKWIDSYILDDDSVETYDGDVTLYSRAIELWDGRYTDEDDDWVELENGKNALKDEVEHSDYNSGYILKSEAEYSDILEDWVYEHQINEIEINEPEEIES